MLSALEIEDESKPSFTDMEGLVNVVLYSSEVMWLLDFPGNHSPFLKTSFVILFMSGTRRNKESEEAKQAKIENESYKNLLKSKQEAPEKYLDGETQTLNRLKKNQETQTFPTTRCHQSVQVRGLLKLIAPCCTYASPMHDFLGDR